MTEAVISASMTHTPSSYGWTGSTVRLLFKGGKVVAGGTQVRATLKAGANGFQASDVFIGHTPSQHVNSWDLDANLKARLKFGGVNSVSVAGGQTVTSDWAELSVAAGRALLLSIYFTGGGDIARDNVVDQASYSLYFKSGNVAEESSPSGFSSGTSDRELVVSIEVQGELQEEESEDSGISVTIARPKNYDCLAGTVPMLPSYTSYDFWAASNVVRQRRQATLHQKGGYWSVFGDSCLEACVVQEWGPFVENYAFGGDTLDRMLNRIPLYSSLHRSRGVIVMAGINDIGVTSPNMAQINDYMMRALNWFSGPLIWIAITPTTNAAWNVNIANFNAYIHAQLANRANCAKVDINSLVSDSNGMLRDDMRQDLEHLNAAGQDILAKAVRAAISVL